MVTSVLISGAGIAGPVLGLLLARHGVDVTVVEIAESVRPGGQAVDLRGAGRTVFARAGLLERATAIALDQRGIADVDADGRHLTEMRAADFGGEGLISEIEILRGELADQVVDASRDEGVRYRFGTRIGSLTQHDDRVDVTLSDGSTLSPDLVVGADGPHSATRRMVFGPEEQFVHHLGGYMSWFTAPEGTSLDGWYETYNAPGGLSGSLRPGTSPGVAKASLSFVSGPLGYDRHDLDAQRQILTDRFAGVGWRIPQLLQAAREADDFYMDALVQVRMPQWSKGRVVLIGDAASCPSPMTGLGTSLALVEAHVLAGELTTRDDVDEALAAYDRVVRPYVDNAQKLPPGGIRSFAPSSRFAIAARIWSTRLMVSRPFQPLTRRLFFSKSDAIDLPEYPAHRPAGDSGT